MSDDGQISENSRLRPSSTDPESASDGSDAIPDGAAARQEADGAPHENADAVGVDDGIHEDDDSRTD
ncbi:hypothetical protein PZ938_08750 [Luteipulveratus sp. YIM 133132]|uniref:MatE family transporter n=1 Tax=Luteipulveratus flavus TaxID=3031728 RepID=A0ABT6C962_9MICO|nr:MULTISPECIES: hypothetical protein [unclassified Luteipulveratus]MDE9365691.1 hypothetical protein [Luteipulveratus sp. YIM 133132]MDF8264872.1 hypothetical protein [Luteipulveratus sp. YIM 133296]